LIRNTAEHLKVQVDHIVVLMMENRSFDHTLGYLSLPRYSAGAPSVNGLHEDQPYSNQYTGNEFSVPDDQRVYRSTPLFPPRPLFAPALSQHWEDPPHERDAVQLQIADKMSGFVNAYAKKLHARHRHPRPPVLGYPMGYLTKTDVPVYDHLARTFCVCDRWFCSVAGPTMPNRFFAAAGTNKGIYDNTEILLHERGNFKSFFRYLRPECTWRWYSSDPAILRAIDDEFLHDDYKDRFAYFDQFTEEQPRCFLSDLFGSDEQEPSLPNVAWIDPNFASTLRPGGGMLSNDDHPPAPVIAGQKLVNKLYEALRRSKYWKSSMLVVVYDEHGGFFDHEEPPDGLGPRVPALVVSPQAEAGVCSAAFEHASIIKTILLRFGTSDAFDQVPQRVADANDLGVTIAIDGELINSGGPVPEPGEAAIVESDLVPTYLPHPGSTLPRAIELIDRAPTELQELIGTMAVSLRTGVRDIRWWVRRGEAIGRIYADVRRRLLGWWRGLRGKPLLAERRP
jgi:phospholipase C